MTWAGPPWNDPSKMAANLQRIATPLSGFYCPTRRRPLAYPWEVGITALPLFNGGSVTLAGRNDYAANGGDYYTSPSMGPTGPAPLWQSSSNLDGGPVSVTEVENPPGQMTSNARTTFANIAAKATGVMYCGSLITLADITDGTTNTYLAGEKSLGPDWYETGQEGGDNEGALIGENADISRWASAAYPQYPPMQDTPGFTTQGSAWTAIFGSAHANGFFMAFCDGSVQMINYSIEYATHVHLANRKDGQAIDGNKF